MARTGPASNSPRSVGASAVGGGDRRRPAWLWPLLAVLALLLLIALIVALVGGGDDDDDKGNTSTGTGPAATQNLTAGGQALLPATNGAVSQQVGQDASGKGLVVQSVVEGEGFWVGPSVQDRLYIEYGGGAGKTEGGFHPDRAGQEVNLDGPVRTAPSDPADTLNLPSQDASMVKQQGAYINANSVQPAGK